MEDRKDVEEWADTMLAKHREDPKTYEPPAFLVRDMPKVGALMQAAEAVALFVLALLALGAISVALNSG
jgi:hypothetical protein